MKIKSNQKYLTKVFAVIIVIVSLLASFYQLMLSPKTAVFAVTGNCLGVPDNQKDETSPYSLTAPAGYEITEVAIKSGPDCLGSYTADGTYEPDVNGPNACYQIEGIGSQTVTVEKVGQSQAQTCQNISHIEVDWSLIQSPTPTPTDVPSATPSPTDVPSPTPTDTQTQNSPTPTVTVTPTPSVLGSSDEDACTNIDGIQSTIPHRWFQNGLGSKECRQFQYGEPEDPGTSGQVLRTSTQGQVLGASTLASTGNAENMLFVLGLILLGTSFYGIKAAFVKNSKEV